MLTKSTKNTEPTSKRTFSAHSWKRTLNSRLHAKNLEVCALTPVIEAGSHSGARCSLIGRFRSRSTNSDFLLAGFDLDLHFQIRNMEQFLQWATQLKLVRECCGPDQEIDDGVPDVPFVVVGDVCPSDEENEVFDHEFDAVVVEPKQAVSCSPPQLILQGESSTDKKTGRAVPTKNRKRKSCWAKKKPRKRK